MKTRLVVLAAAVLAPLLVLVLVLQGARLGDSGEVSRPPEHGKRPRLLAAVDDLVGSAVDPGVLSSAHAELDGIARCTACHGTGRHVVDERCMACHEEIGVRAARALPLHGQLEGNCRDCHLEHRGREGELIDLDRRAFQHSRTRFELRGAHAELDCEECHELQEEEGGAAFHFQGVPFATCSQCHVDPHGEKRPATSVGPIRQVDLDAAAPVALEPSPDHPMSGPDCGDCHTEASFHAGDLLPGEFEHERDAHFALRGAHASLACDSCHDAKSREREVALELRPGAGASRTCDGCHRDPHEGRMRAGVECSTCHEPTHWNVGFDHGVDTRFALDALHARFDCSGCHADLRFRSAGRECAACHADAASLLAGRFDGAAGVPDVHEGLRCGDCHGATPAANRTAGLAHRCAECHSPEYGQLFSTWSADVHSRGERSGLPPDVVERLRRSGVHNFPLARARLGPTKGP